MVIITNPKMLVLFGALIPPFLSPGWYYAVFQISGAGTDLHGNRRHWRFYALGAGKAGAFLSRSRIRALEIVSGVLLAGGGIWMALRGR